MENKIKLKYNLTGDQRKKLVKAAAAHLETEAKYLGAPSFAYQVGDYTVDRDGTILCPPNVSNAKINTLIDALSSAGFTLPKPPVRGTVKKPERNPMQPIETLEAKKSKTGVTLAIADKELSESARANLERLLEAKGNLISKSLGANDLPILDSGKQIRFPWFRADSTEEEIEAYTYLLTGLVNMARDQKNVTAKEKAVGNEKYAFRCFLLRLGFIGDDFKSARKILLANLSGNAAFKDKGGQE